MGLYKHSHEDVIALTNVIIQLSNRVVELEAELEKLRSNVSKPAGINHYDEGDDDSNFHHPKCKWKVNDMCGGECWIAHG